MRYSDVWALANTRPVTALYRKKSYQLVGSADRAGDHRASELGAVFVFREYVGFPGRYPAVLDVVVSS